MTFIRLRSVEPEILAGVVMAGAWKPEAMDERSITCRPLIASDLERIGEIDRTERIELLFVQHGTRLDERVGDFDASPWLSEGDSEHSVAHQRAECESHLAAGGIARGAFAGERLVGIGLVTARLPPDRAARLLARQQRLPGSRHRCAAPDGARASRAQPRRH